MSGKTFKLDEVEVRKKEFHTSYQPISMHSVNINQTVISDKFKHNYKGVKYFIDYVGDDVIKNSCTALPQMSRNIKYFVNGRKNMSFRIEGDSMLVNIMKFGI